METTIVYRGLYGDNGKENGNHYSLKWRKWEALSLHQDSLRLRILVTCVFKPSVMQGFTVSHIAPLSFRSITCPSQEPRERSGSKGRLDKTGSRAWAKNKAGDGVQGCGRLEASNLIPRPRGPLSFMSAFLTTADKGSLTCLAHSLPYHAYFGKAGIP